jgi:hypothetical protein
VSRAVVCLWCAVAFRGSRVACSEACRVFPTMMPILELCQYGWLALVEEVLAFVFARRVLIADNLVLVVHAAGCRSIVGCRVFEHVAQTAVRCYF